MVDVDTILYMSYLQNQTKLVLEDIKRLEKRQSPLTLLKNIGVLEMEKEFEKKVQFLNERSRILGISDESPLEVEMKEEDLKETLRDVLNELYYSKSREDRSNH